MAAMSAAMLPITDQFTLLMTCARSPTLVVRPPTWPRSAVMSFQLIFPIWLVMLAMSPAIPISAAQFTEPIWFVNPFTVAVRSAMSPQFIAPIWLVMAAMSAAMFSIVFQSTRLSTEVIAAMSCDTLVSAFQSTASNLFASRSMLASILVIPFSLISMFEPSPAASRFVAKRTSLHMLEMSDQFTPPSAALIAAMSPETFEIAPQSTLVIRAMLVSSRWSWLLSDAMVWYPPSVPGGTTCTTMLSELVAGSTQVIV